MHSNLMISQKITHSEIPAYEAITRLTLVLKHIILAIFCEKTVVFKLEYKLINLKIIQVSD